MASFTNFATLSYNGGTTNSNTVTGELLEVLTAEKSAVTETYTRDGNVVYTLSLVNSGTAALTGLTVTDNLGGYTFDGETVYPLRYAEGTLRYYVNGILQTAPTVTAGPPLTVTGLTVPAGGSAMLVYKADVTGYARPDADGTIVNTATVTGDGLAAPLTASATIGTAEGAELRISKAICPAAVTENGQLTYTFVIENTGNMAAAEAENVVLSDTFNPILKGLTATYNGTAWTAGTNYTYDETTGVFTTLAGQIQVPAATYTQRADGTWAIAPGTAVVTVTGTV